MKLPSCGCGHSLCLDHSQNGMGRNTAAPYTLRALAGAPVSTPLTWGEVERGGLDPSKLALHAIPHRLQQKGDLFARCLQEENTSVEEPGYLCIVVIFAPQKGTEGCQLLWNLARK